MNITKYVSLTLASVAMLTNAGFVAAEDKWFVRGHFAYSGITDQSAATSGVESGASSLDAELDAGFASGLGVGYQINSAWAAELGWEYRSNDAEATFDNGRVFSDGDYASNIFYLNGIYSFSSNAKWQPYAGLGVIWGQEIDIDIEDDGVERSFSADGDVGFQIFAGMNRAISENWMLQGELRYGAISGIDLEEEDGVGQLTGFDYKPLSLQLGLAYRF